MADIAEYEDSDPEDGPVATAEPGITFLDLLHRVVVLDPASQVATRADAHTVVCDVMRGVIASVHGEGCAGSRACRDRTKAKRAQDPTLPAGAAGPATRTRSRMAKFATGVVASELSVSGAARTGKGVLVVAIGGPKTFPIQSTRAWATALGVATEAATVHAQIGTKLDSLLPAYIHHRLAARHRLTAGATPKSLPPLDSTTERFLEAATEVLAAAGIAIIGLQVAVYRGDDPDTSVRGKIDLVGVERVGKREVRCVVIDLKCRHDESTPMRAHALQVAIYAALVDLGAPLVRAPGAYVLHACLSKGVFELFQVDCRAIAHGILDYEWPKPSPLTELFDAWEARRDREGLPTVSKTTR